MESSFSAADISGKLKNIDVAQDNDVGINEDYLVVVRQVARMDPGKLEHRTHGQVLLPHRLPTITPELKIEPSFSATDISRKLKDIDVAQDDDVGIDEDYLVVVRQLP
nr:hypothetical protein Iba_chr07cCG9190 [Ipomoea batatas]